MVFYSPHPNIPKLFNYLCMHFQGLHSHDVCFLYGGHVLTMLGSKIFWNHVVVKKIVPILPICDFASKIFPADISLLWAHSLKLVLTPPLPSTLSTQYLSLSIWQDFKDSSLEQDSYLMPKKYFLPASDRAIGVRQAKLVVLRRCRKTLGCRMHLWFSLLSVFF